MNIPPEFQQQLREMPEEMWKPRAEEPVEDIAAVLRTPDSCFENLPDYPWTPRYVELPERFGQRLRVHIVDEGPRGAKETVLCLHGAPAWGYLYRRVIPKLLDAGFRVIVPDQIGAGRSDKPARRTDYSCPRHVRWMSDLVEALDLRDVTFFAQDWGALVGLQVVASMQERFSRIALSNSLLPGPEFPEWDGKTAGDMPPLFLLWLRLRMVVPGAGLAIASTMRTRQLTANEIAAYDAPYPDEAHRVGMREFPGLAPLWRGYPGSQSCAAAWRTLSQWKKPFVTLWGENDDMHPVPAYPNRYIERIPGCAGEPHRTFESGHFTPDDQGPLLAEALVDFVARNPRESQSADWG